MAREASELYDLAAPQKTATTNTPKHPFGVSVLPEMAPMVWIRASTVPKRAVEASASTQAADQRPRA
jgi:hypothetical protein